MPFVSVRHSRLGRFAIAFARRVIPHSHATHRHTHTHVYGYGWCEIVKGMAYAMSTDDDNVSSDDNSPMWCHACVTCMFACVQSGWNDGRAQCAWSKKRLVESFCMCHIVIYIHPEPTVTLINAIPAYPNINRLIPFVDLMTQQVGNCHSYGKFLIWGTSQRASCVSTWSEMRTPCTIGTRAHMLIGCFVNSTYGMMKKHFRSKMPRNSSIQ